MKQIDLSLFGTQDYPLRASSLPQVATCTLRTVMKFLEDIDHSGAAADTGSAGHHAVAKWHELRGEGVEQEDAIEAAIASMEEFRDEEFPLADLERAGREFKGYAHDTRNQTGLTLCEEKITLTLDPHAIDPTGERIYINGTVDQVRERAGYPGQYELYDMKSSRFGGRQLTENYALQLAAYAVGASQKLGAPVRPGKIIRLTSYSRKNHNLGDEPDDVFFDLGWGLREAVTLLDTIALSVALIRSGQINATPSQACTYCPLGGVFVCMDKLHELCEPDSLPTHEVLNLL